jgi:hypothetical protein
MTRRVTRLADDGDWEGVLDLRDDCRAAVERGKQLWPVASYCEYRVALEAPADLAAEMLTPDAGRFALGPISEVAAVRHAWADLAPYAPDGPVAALAAHERVLRGEDLRNADVINVLDIPLVVQAWEPAYPIADYKADEATFPPPRRSDGILTSHVRKDPIRTVDPEIVDALTQLAVVWSTESDGQVEVFATDSDGLTPISSADAFALMAWTAASGGAHGRRRGMAPGRFAAWWAAVAVAGELDRWPLPDDEMTSLVTDCLRWYTWDEPQPTAGWSFRLAIEDTERGCTYAVVATDSA